MFLCVIYSYISRELFGRVSVLNIINVWCSVRVIVFFFFKQKTAYEMRISDWSSDVCSSDLIPHQYLMRTAPLQRTEHTIEAEAANKRLARVLDVAPGDPLLTLSRRTWSRGHVASYVRLTHPAAKYRFVGSFKVGDTTS